MPGKKSIIVGAMALVGLAGCVEESSNPITTGGVPAFSASCPNFIEVNSDGSGPVFINAQKATVNKFNDNFYEAVLNDVTASISVNPDRSVSVTYNKRGVGNGVCQMN